MKETGRNGLTALTYKFLKLLESIEDGFYFCRNHQTLGSVRGRPDFEILIKKSTIFKTCQFLALELKGDKWDGKLDKWKLEQREKIEKAGGVWHTCQSLDEIKIMLNNYGVGHRVELE